MVTNKTFILCLLVTGIWLTGCSVISPTASPAIDVYTLSADIQPVLVRPETKASTAIILALSPIRSPQGLMSTSIIYRDTDYGFNSYAYSRWSDSPSQLLENYLQQSLIQSQYISAIIPKDSRSHADLLLEGTLIDFSHHIKAADTHSTAVVSLMFYLINPKNKKLLASKQLTEEVNVEPNNAKGAAKAMNQASKAIATALQTWLSQEIISMTGK